MRPALRKPRSFAGGPGCAGWPSPSAVLQFSRFGTGTCPPGGCCVVRGAQRRGRPRSALLAGLARPTAGEVLATGGPWRGSWRTGQGLVAGADRPGCPRSRSSLPARCARTSSGRAGMEPAPWATFARRADWRLSGHQRPGRGTPVAGGGRTLPVCIRKRRPWRALPRRGASTCSTSPRRAWTPVSPSRVRGQNPWSARAGPTGGRGGPNFVKGATRGSTGRP
jgi:hypothetical protein